MMPHTKPYFWYLFGAVIVLLALGGWFFLYNQPTTSANNEDASDDVSKALAELVASGATSTRGDGFTVEIDPVTPANVPPAPKIERPIPATPDLNAEGRMVVVGKIDAAEEALKKNPASFAGWMEIGMLRSVVKDYVGAKEAWEYAAILGPNTATPFGNLGDLYTFYLKDYAKAETNLQKAIANDPKNSARFYRALYELYTIWKPNSDASAQALKDGISKFPDALDLHVLLARWYKEKGRTNESRAAYDVAISVAVKAGNTEATTQLRAERP